MACKLYIVTNRTNGKMYAGITERTLDARFSHHARDAKHSRRKTMPLHNAINKYGVDKFYIELMHAYENREQAAHAERETIANLRLRERKFGYNVALGGEGSPVAGRGHSEKTKALLSRLAKDRMTPEMKTRISKSLSGRKLTEEHVNNMRGYRHSPATRQKMSLARRGAKRSEEFCRKNKERQLGKRFSSDHKAALALSQSVRYEREVWASAHFPTEYSMRKRYTEPKRAMPNYVDIYPDVGLSPW